MDQRRIAPAIQRDRRAPRVVIGLLIAIPFSIALWALLVMIVT